jgi:hypothetical protein
MTPITSKDIGDRWSEAFDAIFAPTPAMRAVSHIHAQLFPAASSVPPLTERNPVTAIEAGRDDRETSR